MGLFILVGSGAGVEDSAPVASEDSVAAEVLLVVGVQVVDGD